MKSPVGDLSKEEVLQSVPQAGELNKAGFTFLMFSVYETKRCNGTSEKAILEAGNNTMDIDCTDVFKGTSRGRNAVALITYQSLGDILNGSFFSDRRGPKEVKINSQVISGSIGVKENVNLAKPVFLTFQHTRVSKIQAGSVGITFGGVLSRSWQETDCNSDHSESRQLEFPSWQW